MALCKLQYLCCLILEFEKHLGLSAIGKILGKHSVAAYGMDNGRKWHAHFIRIIEGTPFFNFI